MKKYGEILGAHMIGPEVTELLPELTAGAYDGTDTARDRTQHPCTPDAFRSCDGSRAWCGWNADPY